MYDEDLEIDKWNCADYYYIADYFQDDVQLPKQFYSESPLTNDMLDYTFLQNLTYMKTDRFIKITSIFKNIISSENYIKIIIHRIKNTSLMRE